MYHNISNLKYKRLRHAVSVPFIFGMAIPIVILDICLELYHQVAFPLYGIARNSRKKYIQIDRHKLSYLNNFDKVWCVYCGYANGLLNYAVKIAGDTETYWCGIKHNASSDFVEPANHADFLTYNDEKTYKEFVSQDKCKLGEKNK